MARQITVQILGDAKNFTKATEDASKAGNGLAGTLTHVARVGTEALLAVSTAAVGFGVASLHSFVDAGKAAKEMSEQFGMSGHAASAWTEAAAEMGVSQDTLSTGFTVLTRTLGNMDLQMDASGKAGKLQTEIFKELHIKIKDTHGALRPLTDVMSDVADRFHKMSDGTEKTTIAMKIFGKTAGPELVPFLDQGSKGIAALMEQARKYGAVLTDEDIKASHEFELKTALLHVQIAGITDTIGRMLIPIALELAGWISSVVLPALKRFSDWFVVTAKPKIMELVGTIRNDLAPPIAAFKAWIDEHWPEIEAVVTTALRDIGTVVGDVKDDFMHLANAVQGLQGNSNALQNTLNPVIGSFKLLHEHTKLVARAVEVMAAAYIIANVVQGIANVVSTVHGAIMTVLEIKTKAVTVATNIAAAAQWLWNLAMSANPIALVIIGVALLIAGIIFLVTHLKLVHQWFSALWDKLTNNPIGFLINVGIGALIGVFKNTVVPTIQVVIGYFQGLWSMINQVIGSFGTVIGKIGDFARVVSNLPGISQGSAIASGIGHLLGRAAGGPVLPGGMYTVGERGPETLVMGSRGGTIIPHGAMMAGAVGNVYLTVNGFVGNDQQLFRVFREGIRRLDRAQT